MLVGMALCLGVSKCKSSSLESLLVKTAKSFTGN